MGRDQPSGEERFVFSAPRVALASCSLNYPDLLSLLVTTAYTSCNRVLEGASELGKLGQLAVIGRLMFAGAGASAGLTSQQRETLTHARKLAVVYKFHNNDIKKCYKSVVRYMERPDEPLPGSNVCATLTVGGRDTYPVRAFAFCTLEGSTLSFDYVLVATELRDKGVGRMLVAAVHRAAIRELGDQVSCRVVVDPSEKAERFWGKWGGSSADLGASQLQLGSGRSRTTAIAQPRGTLARLRDAAGAAGASAGAGAAAGASAGD